MIKKHVSIRFLLGLILHTRVYLSEKQVHIPKDVMHIKKVHPQSVLGVTLCFLVLLTFPYPSVSIALFSYASFIRLPVLFSANLLQSQLTKFLKEATVTAQACTSRIDML